MLFIVTYLYYQRYYLLYLGVISIDNLIMTILNKTIVSYILCYVAYRSVILLSVIMIALVFLIMKFDRINSFSSY